MANYTKKEMISNNMLKECYEKFRNANYRWEDYWWEGVVAIFQEHAEWSAKFSLNVVNRTLDYIKVVADIEIDNNLPCVYLIKMFNDNDDYTFLKNGKAKILKDRMKDLAKQKYKRDNVQIARIEVLKYWELPSEHLAVAFENAMKDYLSTFAHNIPNDRYAPIELEEQHYKKIEEIYQAILQARKIYIF